MNFKSPFNCRHLLALLPAALLVVAGCATTSSQQTGVGLMKQPPVDTNSQTGKGAYLHAGDTITITLSGPPEQMDPIQKVIKDDGTISLPYIDRVKAAGKTTGQLEDAIHDLYVPKWYTHMDVTVQAVSNTRVYYVLGQVNKPDRYIYTGEITVSRAIASAGDFTDFADRTEVYLTRANGQRFELNVKRILAGEDPDPPVYPGDRIEVTRRIF